MQITLKLIKTPTKHSLGSRAADPPFFVEQAFHTPAVHCCQPSVVVLGQVVKKVRSLGLPLLLESEILSESVNTSDQPRLQLLMATSLLNSPTNAFHKQQNHFVFFSRGGSKWSSIPISQKKSSRMQPLMSIAASSSVQTFLEKSAPSSQNVGLPILVITFGPMLKCRLDPSNGITGFTFFYYEPCFQIRGHKNDYFLGNEQHSPFVLQLHPVSFHLCRQWELKLYLCKKFV